MRILHNLTDVSNDDDQSFLKLRDDTRRNALIYTEVLQPRSEEVVKIIKAYMHEFRTFECEEWIKNLEQITQEVNTAEQSCHLLLQLHESLTVRLKKSEDDAVVALRGLNNIGNHMKLKDKNFWIMLQRALRSKNGMTGLQCSF